VETQERIRARIPEILRRLPLVRDLRRSGRLRSLVLVGSLAHRDFVPELSDIDFWVLGRRLKPGLRIETVHLGKLVVEVNLVCRDAASLRRLLADGNAVDLVALRYGEALYDDGAMARLRAGRWRTTRKTRAEWMRTSARWLSRALSEYFSPTCAHCFFGGLYHGARDMLRAHLLGAGEALTEGWEVEAAARRRWPELAECYGRIRRARFDWETYAFRELEDRTRIEGRLGELIDAIEAIALPVYRAWGLRLPSFRALFGGLVRRRRAREFGFVEISPEHRTILLDYTRDDGKHVFARYRLYRGRSVSTGYHSILGRTDGATSCRSRKQAKEKTPASGGKSDAL
jgi:predicted nucleotidyltransferase